MARAKNGETLSETALRLKRRSLKKEFVHATFEGKTTRMHLVPLTPEVSVEMENFAPNPNIIKFGEIETKGKKLKFYAFKNEHNVVFIRLNKEFIPLDKFNVRKLIGLASKEAWYVGLMGKRSKKRA
jgi:hypothetical protein